MLTGSLLSTADALISSRAHRHQTRTKDSTRKWQRTWPLGPSPLWLQSHPLPPTECHNQKAERFVYFRRFDDNPRRLIPLRDAQKKRIPPADCHVQNFISKSSFPVPMTGRPSRRPTPTLHNYRKSNNLHLYQRLITKQSPFNKTKKSSAILVLWSLFISTVHDLIFN